ncbi:MAG: hypothetical protein WCC68_03510, partial [Methanoregula sp.]
YLNIYFSGCCGSTTIFPFSSTQRILPPSFNPYEDTIKAGIVVRKDPPLLVARFNIDSSAFEFLGIFTILVPFYLYFFLPFNLPFYLPISLCSLTA